MPTYRYSDAGVAKLLRQAQRQSLITGVLTVVACLILGALNGGLKQPLILFVIPFPLLAGMLWQRRRTQAALTAMIRSTEFELDNCLITRNSVSEVTLSREEIRTIRYLKDGVVLQGHTLQQTVQIKPELEGYEDLVKRVEQWVPSNIPRVQSAGSVPRLVLAVTSANLVMLTLALSLTGPIGAVLCIAEALALLWCIAFAWRSKFVNRRLKMLMVVALIPALSLIGRAYLLVQP